MGAPEMYPDAYQEHLTGDPVYDKAFAALAGCPTFNQVEQALRTYAHELAEKIREETARLKADGILEPDRFRPCRDAADQIDPEMTDSGA